MEDTIATYTLEMLRKDIQDGSVETVIMVFPDQYGQFLGKRMTGSFFLKNSHINCCNYLLAASIEMDPQQGFPGGGWEHGYGDYLVRPDYSSLKKISWLPKTVLIIGDLQHEDGRIVPENPRTVLKSQCIRLEKMGMKAMMASELEFYLFRNTYDDVMCLGYGGLKPASTYPIDYHIFQTEQEENILGEVRSVMNASGISIESSKGETGKGQCEITMEYGEALEMADRHGIFKLGLKTIAQRQGASATFMAKYSHNDSGSSCHLHISLFDTEKNTNLFSIPPAVGKEHADTHSSDARDGETELFTYFLGGVHALSRDLFLFFAPNINSYKRYSESSFAPTHISWDYDNRTVSIRVIGDGISRRVENRIPGADANPYLAYAATIAAGLYGIEHKIEPPERCSGSAYEANDSFEVPRTLKEAADNMDRSPVARKIFGDNVVDHYVRHARLEVESFDRIVTEWELKRYFERY